MGSPTKDLAAALLAKIRARQARIGILGLGAAGQPSAPAFVVACFPVVGFDIDAVRVARLQRGETYLKHIPETAIRDMRSRGFEATDRFERLGDVDAALICVPTPLTEAREPDLSCVIQSAQAIAGHVRLGQLVILESTTYPGTTRQVVQPILESGGRRAGSDFFLAYSPEREDPGNSNFSTSTIPKIVGGLDACTLELAAELYGQAIATVVRVSSLEV